METVKEIVSYSFYEKFFQVEPEGRIRRYQFLARLLSIALVFGLLVYLGISFIMVHIFNPFIWIFFGSSLSLLLTIVVLFFMYRVVYMKRLRDIWIHPDKFMYVFYGAMTWHIAKTIMLALYMVGALSGDIYTIVTESSLFPFVDVGINIVMFLLFLFCLCMPGKPWDNEYGKNPLGTILTFFG